MLANKKIIVVLPAYNAAETLKQTYDEFARHRQRGNVDFDGSPWPDRKEARVCAANRRDGW